MRLTLDTTPRSWLPVIKMPAVFDWDTYVTQEPNHISHFTEVDNTWVNHLVMKKPAATGPVEEDSGDSEEEIAREDEQLKAARASGVADLLNSLTTLSATKDHDNDLNMSLGEKEE